jgi:hypothetical protein
VAGLNIGDQFKGFPIPSHREPVLHQTRRNKQQGASVVAGREGVGAAAALALALALVNRLESPLMSQGHSGGLPKLSQGRVSPKQPQRIVSPLNGVAMATGFSTGTLDTALLHLDSLN